MKRFFSILIFLLILLTGCSQSKTKQLEILTDCEQNKYYLIWHIDVQNPEWKSEYLHYLGTCVEDTATAKKLAELDADHGNYSFLIYGLLENIELYENIYSRYPISFYNPGCVSSDIGEFYNLQVKRLLKKNLSLDYDSLVQAAYFEELREDQEEPIDIGIE